METCFKANRLADALLIANIFNRWVCTANMVCGRLTYEGPRYLGGLVRVCRTMWLHHVSTDVSEGDAAVHDAVHEAVQPQTSPPLLPYSSDLYQRAMRRYMKRCPKPYMGIVRASLEGDWAALVKSRPVGQWRETLALLATYTGQVRLGGGEAWRWRREALG